MTLNKHYKKIILGVFIAVIVVGAGGVFNTIRAEGGFFSISGIASNAVTTVAQFIGQILGYIAGVAIMIAGMLLSLAFSLNKTILMSVTVQVGWNIVLSFANLGFVLAIIVMAFATILRWESYGMKQILWKLIVAALLVNFSLVIAGAFLSVSDILSDYFMSKGGLKDPSQWSTAIRGMFKDQSMFKISSDYNPGAVGGGVEAMSTTVLGSIASIFFIVILTIVAAITMLAITVMLFIRYIFLGILLILSPIVWLLWIFPDTQNLWQKWWDNFLRWTFFAPIMLFFVYLALYTMNPTSVESGWIKPSDAASSTATAYSAALKAGQITWGTGGLAAIGNFAIVLGLLFGGLMAANYLSITGASTAMGMAQKASKGVGMFAWKKGQQYGTRGAEWTNRTLQRNIGGVEAGKERSIATAMSEFTAKHRWAGRLGVGYVAQGVAKWSAAATENQVKQAKDNIKDKNIPEQVAMLSTGDVAARAAILQNLRDKELLHLVPQEFIDKNILTHKERERWQAMGQAKEYEKLERRLGRNVEMVQGKDRKNNNISLREATDKLSATMRHEDWQKISPDALLDKKYGEELTRAVVNNDPSALATITSKAKQGQFVATKDQIGLRDQIKNAEKKIAEDLIKTNMNASKDIISDLDNIIKSIEGPSFDIGAAGLMDATDPVKNITKKLEWIQKKDKNKFNNLDDEIKLVLQRNKTTNRNLAGRFSEFEFIPGAFQQPTP